MNTLTCWCLEERSEMLGTPQGQPEGLIRGEEMLPLQAVAQNSTKTQSWGWDRPSLFESPLDVFFRLNRGYAYTVQATQD